ncbi:MAG: hypothetical protein O9289_15205 [Rhodobacteraceae bacterium]|jgi:hypothetical protein|nr:hypothetical protein [Paracoccaceae bacterium]MCZ8084542.1 hypothetical protein [Paracoccaceae bacterium]
MNYLDRAAAMGQDTEALARGSTLTSIVTVQTVDDYRKIFAGNATDAHRTAYTANRPDNPETDPRMQALMDYIFGTAPLTEDVTEAAAAVFPVKILVTSGQSVTIDSDITIGPNGQSYALNAETLTFDGGSLTINSTVSVVTADNLVITPNPAHTSANNYHLGIIGNAGAAGTVGAAGPATTGVGSPGNAGGPPIWGTCNSSGIGGTGGTGATGQTGSIGGNGNGGDPSMVSTITIGQFDSSNVNPFVMLTYSGAGGAGGVGGQGGKGQTGGTGGSGCSSGCEGSNGGSGGTGGVGGSGGPGGPGGAAVSGQPIAINFPGKAIGMLSASGKMVSGGPGGQGGAGGPGGDGGAGGAGGKKHSQGPTGGSGQAGPVGATGTANSTAGVAGAITVIQT